MRVDDQRTKGEKNGVREKEKKKIKMNEGVEEEEEGEGGDNSTYEMERGTVGGEGDRGRRRTKRRTAYLCIPECLFRTYCIDIRAV
jgi:hypothetical protein